LKTIINNIISVLNKREKKNFIFLTILSLIVSITDIASIGFLFIVINFYSALPSEKIPLLAHWGVNAHSIFPAILLMVLFIFKSVGGYYVYKMQYQFVFKVASRLSKKNLLLYLEGSFIDHVNIDSSVYIRKISQQPIEFAHYVLSAIQQMITEIILITLTVIVLIIIDAKLLLIISLVLVPAIIILRYVVRKKLFTIRQNIKETSENVLKHLNEALSGFIESNIYNRNDFFTERYAHSQNILNTYLADLQTTQGMPSRFFEVFSVFGLFILIITNQLFSNTTDIFTLSAFAAAAYKIIPGISRIINFSSQLKTYEYTGNELAKEVESKHRVKGDRNVESLNSIEFDDISFTYKNVPVLSGINFKIIKGTFVGIKGTSGKGKTTLMNLLLGFLSPSTGRILLNGNKKNETERQVFWNKISYVKQEPFIVHDSVLRNITLFEEKANDKKLNEVIEATGLTLFIQQFSEGLEKIITEDGKNISGGQRQRIAIARALYKDADVIILDEPFNELDEQSEFSMLCYFKQLSRKGKAIILITHNTQSLAFCDSVIDLHET
jgi:ABC-type bacteriocin/lantibiotic exporter with double-glycine peptidase domain